MKTRDERILDRLYETETEREWRRDKYCILFFAILLVFGVAITGCGTYWNFGESEIPTKTETVSCKEISVPETNG